MPAVSLALETPSPRWRRLSSLRRLASPRRGLRSCLALSLALGLALGLGACAGQRGSSKHPGAALVAAGWIDGDTTGDPTREDPERLAALSESGLRGRIIRLDRLLDLYDGARFAGDSDARDSLWQTLGGYSSTRGIDASREVVLRLLDEAYALEDLANAELAAAESDSGAQAPVSDEDQRFISDAIMLLSADMFLPDSAEALITQTLAYRILTETGHPRIADNAHWRLYDHVRGVLREAVETGPGLRDEVSVHALYTVREDLSGWLEDLAPHAQPPLPSPSQLWLLLTTHRDALAEIPRWRGVLSQREAVEVELRETVMALLPHPRDPSWELPELPRGTGHRESLAPVMLLRPGEVVLDPDSAEPRSFVVGLGNAEDLRAGLEGLLARDGRGTLLVAAHPELPAPEYADALAALAQARAATLEFAVHEARLEDSEVDGALLEDGSLAPATLALSLLIARPDDLSLGARALRGARIHVQLSGRGPRVRVDGQWLAAAPALPSDVEALAARLHAAYPRERAVSLSVAPGVQHRQLIDLLSVFSGGVDSPFLAVGWLPSGALAGPDELPRQPGTIDATLDARAALSRSRLVDTLVVPTVPGDPGSPPVPLVSEDGQARVNIAAESLFACIPELEAALPRDGLRLRLDFVEGRFSKVEAEPPRRLARSRGEAIASIERCARERLVGLSLPGAPGAETKTEAKTDTKVSLTVTFKAR